MPVFILTGFFVWDSAAKAEWVNHLVISAVQITEGAGKTNHDFIEIYNPTNIAVNLKGYRLVKRTKTGTSDSSVKSWTEDTIIKAHGWRLWASSEEGSFPTSVGADDFTTQVISADNGIAIRFGAVDTGEVIDSVAWGAAENIFKEGQIPTNPTASEKLIRKPATSEGGNGEDANNNLIDFIVSSNFTPRNSATAVAPVLENPQISDPVPDSALSPATPSTFVGTIKNVPTAEAGADKAAVVGELVEFDGSDSFDLAGKELTYGWTFGDGATSRGAAVSHAYQMAGQYAVTLKVDNGENTAEDSLNAKISEPEFSDKIIISEVLPNPAGADKDGEWIELANLSGKKINLRGWILEAKTKTGAKRYIFSGDNFIEPNRHLLVKRSQSNLVLANTGGEVNLLLPPDKNLSKVSYGEAKEGKSYALINNNWQWTGIPTPGKENIPEVADPLRLSEASKTAKSAAEGKNIVAAATDSSNIILPESGTIADEEFSSAPNSGGKNQAQNNIIQLVAFSDLEKYLGKAIGDKISDAVSSLVIKPAEPNEKISAPRPSESLLDAQSAFAAAGNAAPAQQQNSRQNIRNNPWFYSSLILSGLSLFLVWRYQELRKRIK